MIWQLAEAKNRFSEVVRQAIHEGPQQISRRNENIFVLSEHDYHKLMKTHPDFKDFLLHSTPDLNGLDLARDPSPMRKVTL